MSSNRYLLTVHYKYKYMPRTTYMFFNLRSALEGAAIIKKLNPDIRVNLIRKELTPEQCEAVLSTGNLPT